MPLCKLSTIYFILGCENLICGAFFILQAHSHLWWLANFSCVKDRPLLNLYCCFVYKVACVSIFFLFALARRWLIHLSNVSLRSLYRHAHLWPNTISNKHSRVGIRRLPSHRVGLMDVVCVNEFKKPLELAIADPLLAQLIAGAHRRIRPYPVGGLLGSGSRGLRGSSPAEWLSLPSWVNLIFEIDGRRGILRISSHHPPRLSLISLGCHVISPSWLNPEDLLLALLCRLLLGVGKKSLFVGFLSKISAN